MDKTAAKMTHTVGKHSCPDNPMGILQLMANKDRFLFPEDRISLTVFNTYGLEGAS